MKYCETTLPEGYNEVYRIDATNKKTGLILNLVSLPLFVIAALPFFLAADYTKVGITLKTPLLLLVFMIGIVAYLVLHELTHGAVYKLLTKQKLKFGISWSCAFCGIPDVYTYRLTAILSLIAPLVVFSVLFIALAVVLYGINMNAFLLCGMMFGLHFGGCVGDMYVTLLFLTKYRKKTTLMRDTGPEQTFYQITDKTEK